MAKIDWSLAVVPRAKLAGYLLEPDHPEGWSKAQFFLSFGYIAEQWESLAAALRRHAAESSVISVRSAFGVKYVADGPFFGRDERTRWLRSIWIVENEDAPPRFVTAYPLEPADEPV